MTDLLVERFLRYFANGDPTSEVLRPGCVGKGCANLRAALGHLGFEARASDPTVYDEGLHDAVERFQVALGHSVHDGLVGPGTRRLLTGILLTRFGPNLFRRMGDPEEGQPPRVFISYSSADAPVVDKLDQWLRDHGMRTIRYTHSFHAGQDILDLARKAIAVADKTLVVHSAHSVAADWVRAEIAVAEELERRLGQPLIVYLRLDGQPLPAHDQYRIAIAAAGKPLREVGRQLLQAICDRPAPPPSFPYDENEPLG